MWIDMHIMFNDWIVLVLKGLICRALPRGSPHSDLKERTVLSGSIMQGKLFVGFGFYSWLPCWESSLTLICSAWSLLFKIFFLLKYRYLRLDYKSSVSELYTCLKVIVAKSSNIKTSSLCKKHSLIVKNDVLNFEQP